MKTKLYIIFILLGFCANAQQTDVLRVRKVQYDTSFYTIQTIDSGFVQSTTSNSVEPIFYKNETGYWFNNVFFAQDTVYIFSSEINKLNKRTAKRNPTKFWKKINRKIAQNKLSVFQVAYKLLDSTTLFNKNTVTNTHFQIRNRETGQTTIDESIIIKSDTLRTGYFNRNYQFISEYDTILLANLRDNQFICSSSKNYQFCLFSNLVSKLEKSYKNSRVYGHFKTSSKIDGNKYKIYFNFESQLCRKAVFIENSDKRYYIDFELEKDSIFILNSPAGSIYAGKIARKNNKIKFRDNRKNYTFYSKKQFGYSRRMWSVSLDEYYQYPIAL